MNSLESKIELKTCEDKIKSTRTEIAQRESDRRKIDVEGLQHVFLHRATTKHEN